MSEPFTDHRLAAMALLLSGSDLSVREGQFCGGISFEHRPLTPKQRRWLDILLERYGLAPLDEPQEGAE